MIITILFVFFVLPISTILLAIVLQNVLKCPYLVAITFFAIYLIVAFAAFSANLAVAIIAAIVYTILAFITAYAVNFVNTLRQSNSNNNCGCNDNNNNNNNNNTDTDNLSINANLTPCSNNGGRTGWVRGCYRRR